MADPAQPQEDLYSRAGEAQEGRSLSPEMARARRLGRRPCVASSGSVPENPTHRKQSPDPDYAALRHELQTNKYVTLQLPWEEYRNQHPEGYRYSRFCEPYRAVG